jgi:phage terminase small subunit
MSRYYVYALIDPRDLQTFYIGKGKADRRFRSMRNIPDKTTGKKGQRINEIEDAGLQVQAVVASWHDDEEEAYEAERQKIAEVGLDNLLNMKIGGNGRQADRGKTKPDRLTPKQEKFAQLVASGVNQSDAYREAYDASKMQANSIHVNSAKMVADTKIALRIAELRQPAVEQVGLTVEKLIHELEEAQALAKETDQPNAMTQAIMAKAKLSDLIPAAKSENLNVNVTQLEERLKEGRDNVVRLRTTRDPAALRETLLALGDADGNA